MSLRNDQPPVDTSGLSIKRRPSVKSGVLWMFGGGTVQAGVAFLANLILVRYVAPDQFGVFAIALANLGLVHSILNFRLGDLIVRTKAEDIDHAFTVLISSYAAAQVLLAGSISLAMLWATIGVDLGILLLWTGVLLSIPIGVAVQLFEKGFDYGRISQFETSSHAISHILTAVLAIVGGGAVVLFARNLARLIVIALWLAWLGALRLAWPRIVTLAEIRLLITRNRDLWFDGIFEQGIERMTVLLIAAAGGATGAGHFYQARRLAAVPGQLIDPIASRIGFNYFSNRVAESTRIATLARALVALAVFMTGATVALVMGADLLIMTAFGERWLPVVGILSALGPFVVSLSLVSLLRAHFSATHALYRFVLLGRVPVMLIAIGLGWALVSFGVASETRLAMLLSAGYCCAFLITTAYVFLVPRFRSAGNDSK